MKAVRVHAFGGPEVLQIEDIPVPAPAEGEVLVRLEAAGINPVDTYIRTGAYARKPTPPYTPGTDGAGVVEAVGPGVSRPAPGDRVYVAALLAHRSTGTYARCVACDAEHVHRLPAHVSFAQGAALGVPYATAYRALFRRAGLVAGETVLVHGASGGVGIAALQFARAAGQRVIGTAGSSRGRELVAANGAHHTVDHTVPGYLDEIVALTGGRGVDAIVEMLANANLERDFGVLATYGRIVIVGSRGSLEFTPRLVMSKEADVRGMTLWNVPPADRASAHAAILAGLEARTLAPVVGKAFPLDQVQRAHSDVLEPGAYGKIVLIPA